MDCSQTAVFGHRKSSNFSLILLVMRLLSFTFQLKLGSNLIAFLSSLRCFFTDLFEKQQEVQGSLRASYSLDFSRKLQWLLKPSSLPFAQLQRSWSLRLRFSTSSAAYNMRQNKYCTVPDISLACSLQSSSQLAYKLMQYQMISSFKGLTPNSIANALSAFAGPRLDPQGPIPKGLTLVRSPEGDHIACKFIYADFKQALRHLLEISRICRSLNYQPQIFNVYNRIEIKLFTPVENINSVTAKDCYMALFLEELHQKTVAQAHEVALVRIQEIM